MSFWSDNPAITAAAVGAIAGAAGGVLSSASKGFFDEWVQQKRLRFERDTLRFELDSARQQKLLDAQSALLDELGSVCWKLRYGAIRVAYYGKSQAEEYEAAAKHYVENRWESLSQLRFIGTRASRLFSESAREAIEEFYDRVDDVDSKIERAIAADVKVRGALFDDVYPQIEKDLRIRIGNLILNLAKRVDLTPSDNRSNAISNPPVVPRPDKGPSS
jgi:hypothetical protein